MVPFELVDEGLRAFRIPPSRVIDGKVFEDLREFKVTRRKFREVEEMPWEVPVSSECLFHLVTPDMGIGHLLRRGEICIRYRDYKYPIGVLE